MISRTDHAKLLFAGVGGLLVIASAIGLALKLTAKSESAKKTIANMNARIIAWWLMAAIFGGAIAIGNGGTCVLFAIISFLALREMITLAPTRRADHRTLFWAFFVMLPLQYYLLYIGWYGMFAIFIPVYGFLFLAIRSTLTGDSHCYLERTAKIYWGVMICIYCLSHAPAVLMLNIDGTRGWELLAFMVIVVQMSDVLQYTFGKLFGRRKIAPHLSPNKTWEGFIGGVIGAMLLGAGLKWLTPFSWLEVFLVSLVIAIMGFFGGIVMSAIKRDVGVKDFGDILYGHGGMLDRVDSIVFAAPIFFHICRYWHGIN